MPIFTEHTNPEWVDEFQTEDDEQQDNDSTE